MTSAEQGQPFSTYTEINNKTTTDFLISKSPYDIYWPLSEKALMDYMHATVLLPLISSLPFVGVFIRLVLPTMPENAFGSSNHCHSKVRR